MYDTDGRLLGEYGASASSVVAETIWLSPSVGEPNAPFGGDDGADGYAPLAAAVGGSIYWVQGNHLGVPVMMTDASGAAASPGGFTVVGFPGQTRTASDLYYNRYRDYDPTLGRYIQADPIGLAGGSNPYAYAANNPLRFIDPLGIQAAQFRGAIVVGEVVGERLFLWCRSNIVLCMRTIGPPAIRGPNVCKAVTDALSGDDGASVSPMAARGNVADTEIIQRVNSIISENGLGEPDR